jgi:hypothetical protein
MMDTDTIRRDWIGLYLSKYFLGVDIGVVADKAARLALGRAINEHRVAVVCFLLFTWIMLVIVSPYC